MNKPNVDLRYDYDEKAPVQGGTLYRKGSVVQVWWEGYGTETWSSENTDRGLKEAKRNFQEMKKRFNE